MGYTITDLIDYAEEHKWEDDDYNRQYLHLLVCGTGETVDFGDYYKDEWEEYEMLFQDFEPFMEDDDYGKEYKRYGDRCFRTHGYSHVYCWFTLELPQNRTRGTQYTSQQVESMVKDKEWCGDDVCAGGFDYYNVPEEVDEDS